MAKTELAAMTTKEAEESFRQNPVILIPMGSQEEHGPQTPMGDYRIADVVARRIAEQSGAIYTPVIPFGYSEVFRNFPGCITLTENTLFSLLYDVCDCLLAHDLDHLLFVCGHSGNMPVIEHVARRIRRERGIRLATIEPWRWLTPELLKRAYGTDKPPMGHGSEPMNSLCMYLYPEEVRMDLAEKGNPFEFGGMKLHSLSVGDFEGVPVHIYLNMEEITPNGVLGDPRAASKDTGKILIDHVVSIGVRFVRFYAGLDTRT